MERGMSQNVDIDPSFHLMKCAGDVGKVWESLYISFIKC